MAVELRFVDLIQRLADLDEAREHPFDDRLALFAHRPSPFTAVRRRGATSACSSSPGGGIDEWASHNGIVVLDDASYSLQTGMQISIVYKMVQRMTGRP